MIDEDLDRKEIFGYNRDTLCTANTVQTEQAEAIFGAGSQM